MRLYRFVDSDGDFLHVEARDLVTAVELWRQAAQAEEDEEPNSVFVIDDKSVVRADE